jgi:hypothetical protein
MWGAGCLAFPDDEYFPSFTSEFASVLSITPFVAVNLLLPIRLVRLWRPPAVPAFSASMPETPVNEQTNAPLGEDEIGFARKS